MKNKLFPGIIGGLIGFIVGVISGGYLGLVLGGTFLGGLDIYETIGIEGYELATYLGSIIGAIVLTILGVRQAIRITNKTDDKI